MISSTCLAPSGSGLATLLGVASLLVATAPAQDKPGQVAAVDRYGDDLPTGATKRLGTIRFRHDDQSLCATFSPDGNYLASGGMKRVRLWDVRSGKLIRNIPQSAHSLVYSPNGRKLALLRFRRLSVCAVDTGKLLFSREVPIPKGAARTTLADLVFSKNADWVAVADPADGSIHLFNANDGSAIRSYRHGSKGEFRTTRLAISADGQWLAGACGTSIRIWNPQASSAPVTIENPHYAGTSGIVFSPDGKRLYSVGDGRDQSQLRTWNVKTGRPDKGLSRNFKGSSSFGIEFSAARNTVVVLLEHQVREFAADTGKLRSGASLSRPAVNLNQALDVSPDGTKFSVVLDESEIQLWDLRTSREVHATREGHAGMVRGVDFHPNGTTVATGSVDGTVRLWDTNKMSQIRKLDFSPRTSNLMAVSFSPDGKVVAATGNFDGENGSVGAVKIWNVDSGKLVRDYRIPDSGFALSFSHSGKRIAVSAFELSGIHVFGLDSKARVLRLGTSSPVVAVRFTEGDRQVVALTEDGGLYVWDAQSGKLETTHRFGTHVGEANFSKTADKLALTVSSENGEQLLIWDVKKKKMLSKVDRIASGYGAQSLQFSPDGKLLLSGCQRSSLQLWSVATGHKMVEFSLPDVKPYALGFSRDGRKAITGMGDGTTLIWNIHRANRD